MTWDRCTGLACRWFVIALASTVGSCSDNLVEMPPDQPCLDAGYNIAARTFECTGDSELANDRFEAFRDQFRCIPVNVETDPVDQYFHCSVAIGGMTCEQVEKFGDNLACWMSVSAACPYVIEYADGRSLGGTQP